MCLACDGLQSLSITRLHAASAPGGAAIDPTNSGTPTNGANPWIDSLVWGQARWTVSTDAPIRYAFGKGEAPSTFNGDPVRAQPWGQDARHAMNEALANYEAVANVHFDRVRDAADADIVQWQVGDRAFDFPGAGGQHDVPEQEQVLNGWYNASADFWTGFEPGSLAFYIMLHELGHMMGLAHPHDGGGQPDATLFPGVVWSGSPGDNLLNQGVWTVMSYITDWRYGLATPTDEIGHAASLMAFDIAALQVIYGANMDYRTGDDVYRLPDGNELGVGWRCIWDAGGTDTLSHRGGTQAATLDLRAALLDGSANAAGFVSWADRIYGGFTIANGVVIENAIGGRAGDVITGNSVANRLSGRNGDDTITGLGGADTQAGGGGADKFVYEQAADSTAADSDLILGFRTGDGDVIDLSDVVTGVDGQDDFVLAAGPTALAGQVWIETLADETRIMVETNGVAGTDMVIRIAGTVTLTAGTDLIL